MSRRRVRRTLIDAALGGRSNGFPRTRLERQHRLGSRVETTQRPRLLPLVRMSGDLFVRVLERRARLAKSQEGETPTANTWAKLLEHRGLGGETSAAKRMQECSAGSPMVAFEGSQTRPDARVRVGASNRRAFAIRSPARRRWCPSRGTTGACPVLATGRPSPLAGRARIARGQIPRSACKVG
jgi:hypothetical protein